MQVQIFGTKKCKDTRKARRFFAERRIQIHFVDLKEKTASRGELRRFVQKFGIEALVDRDSPRLKDLGLHVARMSDESWMERCIDEPLILKTPLVRNQNKLTVGHCEKEWQDWIM